MLVLWGGEEKGGRKQGKGKRKEGEKNTYSSTDQ